MNTDSWKTTTRPKPRKKQRTVSPQPSTSKHLNKRTLPEDDDDDHSDDIELIDPPPNPPSSTARPPRKEGKAKASELRPNGKVLDAKQNTKPESQVKGKTPESRAREGPVKPKPVKVAAKKPNNENASNHDDDKDPEHEKPPLNSRIDKELERWKSKVKDVCLVHFPLFG